MTSSVILIPARYASTRLPGKPLVELDGIPMIKRVYDACIASKIPTYVLTDNQDIYNYMGGGRCIMDTADYKNGTERCAGIISSSIFDEFDQFINVQGDMPDVTVDMIDKVEWHLQHYPITTVWTEMPKEKQNDPNSVKMIRAGDQALWFGRGMTGYGDWHLGVYGYRKNALQMYPSMQVEKEERIEKLEQLRWLKSGWQIGCLSVQFNGTEINTPEDVDAWHHNKSSQ